jgi:hypothetical protein
MHNILLIFFLFLIFCGPLAVIRTALGCGTLIVLVAVLIALVCWIVKLDQPNPNLPATEPRAAVYQYQQPWIDRQTAPRGRAGAIQSSGAGSASGASSSYSACGTSAPSKRRYERASDARRVGEITRLEIGERAQPMHSVERLGFMAIENEPDGPSPAGTPSQDRVTAFFPYHQRILCGQRGCQP